MKSVLLSTLIVLLSFSCSPKKVAENESQKAKPFPTEKLDSLFKNTPTEAAFVMKNLSTKEEYVWNMERAKTQFPIASTFKMLNTLIALEEKVLTENDTLKWDGVDRPFVKEWNQNHTLASAYKYSVVWFYQDIARKLDRETYQKYLNKVNLGNKTIGKDIDAFWLDNSLKISCFEQVEFLDKLAHKKLPFSEKTLETGEKIMTEIQNDSIQLIAKTGMYLYKTTESPDGGWYIGYVKKNGKPELLFALNLYISEREHRNMRREISHQILKQLNYIN